MAAIKNKFEAKFKFVSFVILVISIVFHEQFTMEIAGTSGIDAKLWRDIRSAEKSKTVFVTLSLHEPFNSTVQRGSVLKRDDTIDGMSVGFLPKCSRGCLIGIKEALRRVLCVTVAQNTHLDMEEGTDVEPLAAAMDGGI